MIAAFRRMRGRLDEIPASVRKNTSPALYGLHDVLEPILVDVARGRVLDVGCGSMPFRHCMSSAVTEYHGLDIDDRGSQLTYVGNAEDMTEIRDETYDFVLASELLEHVKSPQRVLAEIHRVLKQDGTVVLTVPHLSRIHEAPNDYFRFTSFGVEALMGEAGLVVVRAETTGGLLSFLAHQFCMPVMAASSRFPMFLKVAAFMNLILVVVPVRAMDRLLGTASLFPLGYVVVGAKHT